MAESMMSRELVIFGTGAHARKAFHCWTLAGGAVLGFVDEALAAISPIPGVPALTTAELEAQPTPGCIFVAIGNSEVRRRLMDHYAQRGWQLPVLVHPRASVAPDAVLGAGVMVAACAVIETGSQVGPGAIIDISAVVDHDCRIAAFSHLRAGQVCPPATLWPT